MSTSGPYKGYIFDLDNTLYRDPDAKLPLYELAAKLAAVEISTLSGAGHDEATLFEVIERSLKEHKSELALLVSELGMDRTELFRAYHRCGVDVFARNNGFEPHAALIDTLKNHDMKNMVIVTHASREWAEYVIAHLGLEEIFPKDRIIALDDDTVNFAMKSESETAFRLALDILKCDASETVVFEDSADNLRIPSEMGMATVLVTWGKNAPPSAPHIHHCHERVDLFLNAGSAGPSSTAPKYSREIL